MTRGLDVELKFDDVAVLHNVGFTFGAEFAGGFDGLFGAEFFEVAVITNIGRDEAPLKIGMNSASSFGRGGAFFDGPGTAFFFAGSEERLETESCVGGFDELA